MATSKVFFRPGQTPTCYAAGAITGARFVKPSSTGGSGNYGVVTCTAAAKALGVAASDAASGAQVMVLAGPGTITEVTCAADLTAGQEVESDASGRAIVLNTGKALGLVMADATNGTLAQIKLY
jgi:hypothetical protein